MYRKRQACRLIKVDTGEIQREILRERKMHTGRMSEREKERDRYKYAERQK